jgi:hypothetical protein
MHRWSVGSLESEEAEMDMAFQPAREPGSPVLGANMRKLRHVTGISLRNVNMKTESPAANEKRRASIAKWQQMQQPKDDGNNEPMNPSNSPGRSRRRTTVGQIEIERTLQEINADKLLDTAFTIHRGDELLYVSEVKERSMNPEFREIDFSEVYGRNDTQFKITVCGKAGERGKWKRLFLESIDLGTLNFVSQTPDCLQGPFRQNTVIIHLTDGCYVTSTAQSRAPSIQTTPKPEPTFQVESCSYDAIMKLKTLEECINDALLTIESVNESIQPYLQSSTDYYTNQRKRDQLKHKLQITRSQVEREKRRKEAVQKQAADLRSRIAARRRTMHEASAKIQTYKKAINSTESNTAPKRDLSLRQMEVDNLGQHIDIERGRIIDDLCQIFPIESTNQRSFEFTICGLPLHDPDKCTERNEDEVGAAYGFTAQLVHLLSIYLNTPLRYPIQAFGSQSFIIDPISMIQGSRTFPLWSKGSLFYRFEYGVFLFHKDVEQLINSESLDVIDLSHTLANLKNLLLVISVRGTNADKD